MASTATKRIWYANYACEKSGPFPTVYILGFGNRKVCPVTVNAWDAFNAALVATGYDAQSVGTYNCRVITGGTKLSLHAYGIAIDIDPFALGNGYYSGLSVFSWSKTEFTSEQVKAVEAIRTKNGKKVFRWGGWWTSSRDYMHWEVDVAPADLATGIDWTTVPGGEPLAGLRVEDLQETLNAMGAKDHEGKALVVDGEYGPRTQSAWINGMKMGGSSGITQAQGDVRYVRRGVAVTSTFK